jgi:hypothetical protein
LKVFIKFNKNVKLQLTFASLGNASHVIGDFTLIVSNIMVNSNISQTYCLTTGKFGILICSLTT